MPDYEQKEHPIIFCTEMVKAIQDNEKTMTRRTHGLELINRHPDEYQFIEFKEDLGYPASRGYLWAGFKRRNKSYSTVYIKCPYGQVGGLLWVRETWAKRVDGVDQILYKAQYENVVQMLDLPDFNIKWKPPIHMFKKDARLWLEKTAIRVERLQDISRGEIRAEGVGLPPSPRFTPGVFSELHQEFAYLWDKLNAKRGYSWEFNPWVWPISFKHSGRNIGDK